MMRLKVLLTALLISAFTEAADPMRYDIVGQKNWAPYFTQNEKHPGLFVEILESVLKEAKIPAIPVRTLSHTSPIAIDAGEVDVDIISPSWFKNNKIPSEYIISARIMPIVEYLVFRPEDEGKWPNKTSIINQSVGVVENYLYHDEKSYTRQDFESEKALLLGLRDRKIDVAIVGELPFNHWTSKLDINVKIGPLHSRGYLHIRISKGYLNHLKSINRAIVALQESGEISRIFETYNANKANL